MPRSFFLFGEYLISIVFQPLTISDTQRLYSWFMQPHVAYWWQEPAEWHEFNTKWSERVTKCLSAYHTPWFGHIVHIDAIPIGYIQYFFVTSQQAHGYPVFVQKTVGLDFFIGEQAYLGKKLSTPIIETYLRTIVQQKHPSVSAVLIEPAFKNNRAIHVYTKAGFKSLGPQITGQDTILLMYKNL
jgi:aminoglycoside 6'-N-acetyltransferase